MLDLLLGRKIWIDHLVHYQRHYRRIWFLCFASLDQAMPRLFALCHVTSAVVKQDNKNCSRLGCFDIYVDLRNILQFRNGDCNLGERVFVMEFKYISPRLVHAAARFNIAFKYSDYC